MFTISLECAITTSTVPKILRQVTKKRTPFYNEQFFNCTEDQYNASKLFVVIVYYSDGDTVKITKGNMAVASFHLTYEDAEVAASEIEKDAQSTYPKSMPWTSYFGGIENIEIRKMPLLKETEAVKSKYENKYKLIEH